MFESISLACCYALIDVASALGWIGAGAGGRILLFARMQSNPPNMYAKHVCQTRMPNMYAKQLRMGAAPNMHAKQLIMGAAPNMHAKQLRMGAAPNMHAKQLKMGAAPNIHSISSRAVQTRLASKRYQSAPDVSEFKHETRFPPKLKANF
jgi:hypothetical protein